MKPSRTVSHLFMLSTSLLCMAPIAAQMYAYMLDEEDKETVLTEPAIGEVLSVEQNTADEYEGSLLNEITADAQQNPPELMQPAMPRSTQPCAQADNPYRVNVSHIESKGIGYNQGYTSLEGFFTGKMGYYVPFVDFRAHVFNDGKWATNLGLGTRYVIDPNKWMVGGNFYYDYRSTNHYHYNQIGIGLEAFLTRWEFRANGYLPVGTKHKTIDHDLNWISFKRFSGHNILINENYTDNRESAMRGFNAEIGVHPLQPMRSYDLFIGAGPYYFNANEGRTTWGGKVRAKAEVSRYVYLEASYSYDHVFHSRVQGTLTLSYPFGGKRCYRQKTEMKNTQIADNVMYWRAVQPVERQEIIVTSKRKKTYTKDPIAIDPATGQPIYVVFGNNEANPVTADGTFENPYPHLSATDGAANVQNNSAPGNVLYIFSGNGTPSGMDQGNFLMQSNQRLLGSGIAHQFNTTKGLLTVSAQTNEAPHLTAAAFSVTITAVAGCEISGFDIAATVAGIADNGMGPLRDVNINNNNFAGGGRAIQISQFIGNVNVTNNTSSLHQGFAMQVNVNYPNANVLIENNDISLEMQGISFGNFASGTNTNANINNNNINNISTGGVGINVTHGVFSNPMSTYIIRGNDLSFVPIGIEFTASSSGSSANVIVENNMISTSTTNAIEIINSHTDTVCTRFTGNSSINASGTDFIINNSDGGILKVEDGGVNQGTVTILGSITPAFPCDCGSGEGGDSCP